MVSRLTIFSLVPLIIGALAPLLSVWIISNGFLESHTLTLMSLYMAFYGFLLTCISLIITQNMQKSDKISKERRDGIIRNYEIPHIINSLRMLAMNMGKTGNHILKSGTDGKIETNEACENLYKRARAHIESIRYIESKFLEAELSEHYDRLGSVVAYLEDLEFAAPGTTIDMEMFKHNIKAVHLVIADINNNRQKNSD